MGVEVHGRKKERLVLSFYCGLNNKTNFFNWSTNFNNKEALSSQECYDPHFAITTNKDNWIWNTKNMKVTKIVFFRPDILFSNYWTLKLHSEKCIIPLWFIFSAYKELFLLYEANVRFWDLELRLSLYFLANNGLPFHWLLCTIF